MGFRGMWWNSDACHTTIVINSGQVKNIYREISNGLLKQLPKIKDVKFVYGDYREV